jgi:hypothetical protein
MTYHELNAGQSNAFMIVPRHVQTTFDFDCFGMDDGRQPPGHNFRFLFQLGWSYFIYLYVVGTDSVTKPGEPRWFHTFWIKDCAVVEVDMEERGPPSLVEADVELPVLYRGCTITPPGGKGMNFEISSGHIMATPGKGQELLVSFAMRDPTGAEWTLSWGNGCGWCLRGEGGDPPEMVEGTRVEFDRPVGG